MAIPVLETLLDLIKIPLERLIPDKKERETFERELEREVLRSGLAQLEVNKVEAQHASLFVAGWRPFIGWVCGAALAWHFFLFDVCRWLQTSFWPDAPPLPTLQGQETLLTVLLSMLGLGGLRTYEKLRGVSRANIKQK